jgi:hypothetical protein
MKKTIFLIIVITAQMGLGFAQKNKVVKKQPVTKTEPQKFPEYLLNETEYDFKTFRENGGLVTHDFVVKNIGEAPLIIKSIDPECGCTQTVFTSEPILPGKEGVIKAIYNPMGRAGDFRKSITVKTNAKNPTFQVFIKGSVIAAKFDFGTTYTYQYGFLAVNNNTFRVNFKNTEVGIKNLLMYNLSNKVIKILKIESPINMEVMAPYIEIKPNSEAEFRIKVKPKTSADFGEFNQSFKIYTNDDSLPVKQFYVDSYISEDFSSLSPKELKNAPKFVIDKEMHDFGDVGRRDSNIAIFTINNKGKSDLIIRRIRRSCNCLEITAESMVIKPKKKIKLKVDYSPINTAGLDYKGATIIANDPTKPETNITIKANIVR